MRFTHALIPCFFPLWLLTVCTAASVFSSNLEASEDLVLPSEPFFSSRSITLNNEATHLRENFAEPEKLQRILWPTTSLKRPDTTVVLLNWSRLQNVILQASMYCEPSLQDLVEQVFVWNNQPKFKLEYEHFAHTGCSPQRLRIFNSPSNVYFQARFMGCIDSESTYCWLQDDDYITRPEILRTIHASFSDSRCIHESPSPIILLPPHDYLETDLLRVSVPPRFNAGVTNTSFACLGHGTFLLKSQAKAYLSLLKNLNLSKEEMDIADNYFTILSGQQPNAWFSHNIELSDTQVPPFTVGVKGTERNWRHIDRAMEYLDFLAHSNSTISWPHFSPSRARSIPVPHTAPCTSNPCTISSNIQVLFPNPNPQIWSYGNRMQDMQTRRLGQLGQEGVRWHLDHPVSNAVDGDVKTAFRSVGSAKAGDYVSLTLLHAGSGNKTDQGDHIMELVWLVNAATASVLHAADLEGSGNGVEWSPLSRTSLTCFPTAIVPHDVHVRTQLPLGSLGIRDYAHSHAPATSQNVTYPGANLLECHIRFKKEPDTSKHLRTTLGRDLDYGWSIYEVWLRGDLGS